MSSFSEHFYLLEKREQKLLQSTIKHLSKKDKVLLLTTSNRWEKSDDVPKSTRIARIIEQELIGKCTLIDVSKLTIYDCEGNVSDASGYHCGTKKSNLEGELPND